LPAHWHAVLQLRCVRAHVGDRNRDPQGFGESHPVPRDHGIEALAAHVLHHDEIMVCRGLDLVNGDDVRMVERRGACAS
jgi:hypothetical protein